MSREVQDALFAAFAVYAQHLWQRQIGAGKRQRFADAKAGGVEKREQRRIACALPIIDAGGVGFRDQIKGGAFRNRSWQRAFELGTAH